MSMSYQTEAQMEAKDNRPGVIYAMSSMDEALDYLTKEVQIITERLEGVLRPDEDPNVMAEKLASIRTRSRLADEMETKVTRVHEITARLASVVSRVDL